VATADDTVRLTPTTKRDTKAAAAAREALRAAALRFRPNLAAVLPELAETPPAALP
jgi:hypothetical protein